jgi:hypothetical protein
MSADNFFTPEDMHKGMRSVRLHFRLVAEKYPEPERAKMAAFLSRLEALDRLGDSWARITRQYLDAMNELGPTLVARARGSETEDDRVKETAIWKRIENLHHKREALERRTASMVKWLVLHSPKRSFPALN